MSFKKKGTSAIALMLCLALFLTGCGLVLDVNGNEEKPISSKENPTDEAEFADNSDDAVAESTGAPELPYMEIEKTFSLDGYEFDGFSQSGYTEWYYVSQDFDKIKDAVLKAYPQWEFVDCGMYNTVLEYLPICGYTYDWALASRRVVYDADTHSLIFYKDARTMNDHVMSDINAPEDVLTAAKAYAENELFLFQSDSSMAEADADDYRVEYLNRAGYDEVLYDYNVELYCLNYELHFNAPEKLVLAGGSYFREDGWGLIGYPSSNYLVFVETEGGLEYVGSVFSNDIPPEHSEFIGNVTDLLVDKGLISESINEAEIVPLTAEELESYNKMFEPSLFDGQGDPCVNPLSNFLTSYYDMPEDIHLVRFLWYYPKETVVTDEAEFEALSDAENWPFDNVTTLDSMPVPIQRIPAVTVNEALEKYMGITLDDLSGVGAAVYLEAYDAYYTYTSDCAGSDIVFTRGERQGDIVRLYSTRTYSENSMLTLRLRDDGFWIVSHQAADEDSAA